MMELRKEITIAKAVGFAEREELKISSIVWDVEFVCQRDINARGYLWRALVALFVYKIYIHRLQARFSCHVATQFMLNVARSSGLVLSAQN